MSQNTDVISAMEIIEKTIYTLAKPKPDGELPYQSGDAVKRLAEELLRLSGTIAKEPTV